MVRLDASVMGHRSSKTPLAENDPSAAQEPSFTLFNRGANSSKNEDSVLSSASETEPIYSTIRKVGSSPRQDQEVQLSQVGTPVPLRKSSSTAAQNGSAIRVRHSDF